MLARFPNTISTRHFVTICQPKTVGPFLLRFCLQSQLQRLDPLRHYSPDLVVAVTTITRTVQDLRAPRALKACVQVQIIQTVGS